MVKLCTIYVSTENPVTGNGPGPARKPLEARTASGSFSTARTGPVKPSHRPAQKRGKDEQKRKREGNFIVAQPISHFDWLQTFLFFIALFLLWHPLRYSNENFQNVTASRAKFALGSLRISHVNQNQGVKFKTLKMKGNQEFLGHCQNSMTRFTFKNIREYSSRSIHSESKLGSASLYKFFHKSATVSWALTMCQAPGNQS